MELSTYKELIQEDIMQLYPIKGAGMVFLTLSFLVRTTYQSSSSEVSINRVRLTTNHHNVAKRRGGGSKITEEMKMVRQHYHITLAESGAR